MRVAVGKNYDFSGCQIQGASGRHLDIRLTFRKQMKIDDVGVLDPERCCQLRRRWRVDKPRRREFRPKEYRAL
jgi:hypothetical protein